MSHPTDILNDIRARYAERQAMHARIRALDHGDDTTPEQDAEMLELWMELDKGWTDAAIGALLAEIDRLNAIERAAHWKGDADA